ncbi:hypothetical protein HXX76_012846 [Chlamydomonas incerta]|uniref:MYND-type domain-containing protein n=1 Tax=Chlamydomonas incerta TaxID=51695 RepID=A0A835VVL7_CHLIN|nr:hypothetical protein HXX76_012846 [Chlamydomonas incerta]|eukprot:KAG2426791.1 hypothetical protein HXX76_012846 [Chlamydomonas incerta]
MPPRRVASGPASRESAFSNNLIRAAVQLAGFPATHQRADSSVRELDALAGDFRDVLQRRLSVDILRELLCQPILRAAWLSLAVAATRWTRSASAADWCAAVEEVYLTAASALALVLTVFNLSVPWLKTASALVRAQTLQALAKQLAEVNEGLRAPAAAAAAIAAQTAAGTTARSNTGTAASAVTGAGAGGGGSRVEGADEPVVAAALAERGAFVLSLALAITHGLLACDIDEGKLDLEGGSTAAQQAALTAAFPAYHANLAAALSSSRILEHAAQTHALLHLLGAPAAGRTGDLWAHVIAECADIATWRQWENQLPPRTVFTAPVLRQLLLVRGLQVLCDLDGGPGYGLTPALLRRVPARGSGAELLAAAIADDSVVPGTLCPPELPLHQLAVVLAEHLPSSVGPRAAATLLLRAGFAALAQSRRRLSARVPAADQDTAGDLRWVGVQLRVVVRALEGTLNTLPKALLTVSRQPQMQQLINNVAAALAGSAAIGPSGITFGKGAVGAEPGQQQTGGGDSGGGSDGAASGSGAAGGNYAARCWAEILEGRWRLAIAAAEWYAAAGADMDAGMLKALGRSLMPPPSIWGPTVSPTGGSIAGNVTLLITWPLPPPTPFMAAALAAGLPRALERLLRLAGRPAVSAAFPQRQQEWALSEVLYDILNDARFPFGLLELLLYSPPRQAAALVVTVCKLLRLPVALLEQAAAQQQAEQAHQPLPREHRRAALQHEGALRHMASSMMGLMVRVCGTAAVATLAAGGRATFSSTAVLRLMPLAAPVWLPALSRALHHHSVLLHATNAADPNSDNITAAIAQLLENGVLTCVMFLARRALHLSNTAASLRSQHAKRAGGVAQPPSAAAAAAAAAAAERQQQARSGACRSAPGAAAAAGGSASSSAAGEATGWGAEEEREAAALKRLLLQEVDVVSLLGAALLLLHRRQQWGADYLQKLTGACCAVAALIPEEVGAAVRLPPPLNTRPAAQRQGSGDASLAWGDRILRLAAAGRADECGRFYWCTDSARCLLKNLEAAGSGRSATPDERAFMHAAETLGASLTEWSKRRGAASSDLINKVMSRYLAAAAEAVQVRMPGSFPRVEDLCSLAEARALLPPSAACGNPLCINMAGDSEAELPPPAVACHGRGGVGRGGGGSGRGGSAGSAASSTTGGGGGPCGLRYCSRECAAAHWKAGHREACAAAGAGGTS